MSREEALKILETQEGDYIADCGRKAYDCLVALIESQPEPISREWLEEYGVIFTEEPTP
jgi:DNA-binding winged helix-turn-helix (wHTH) protein